MKRMEKKDSRGETKVLIKGKRGKRKDMPVVP